MTHRPDDLGWTELARYLAGEMNPAERAAFERAIREDPPHNELLDQARVLWRESGRLRQSFDADRGLARIQERTGRRSGGWPADSPLERARQPIGPDRAIWVRRSAAAAALLGAAAAATLVVTRDKPEKAVPAPLSWTETTTRRGQRSELRLHDGTRVILGVESRLRHPDRFGPGVREVRVEGDAYFEVQADSVRPFIVQVGDVTVRDLGTAFTVSNRPPAPLEVVVAEGVVAFRRASIPGDSMILRRAELGRLTASGRLEKEHRVDLSVYLGWTEGRLVFADTPLRSVVPALARWYNVEVRLADSSIGARPLTASFDNEPIGQVLDLIASSLQVRYEPRGSVISIYR